MKPILVEISPGELIDKITILEIKSARITDVHKLKHVRQELAGLSAARDQAIKPSRELDALTEQLKAINETLWEVEDALRVCEMTSNFGHGFIELARAVYRNNDQRALIKRRINDLLGSHLVEEKQYAP